MRKILLLWAGLLLTAALSAQEIRSIAVKVFINKDGSATINTTWDVHVTSGTEWYVPVGNLGKMEVKSFTVHENGKKFRDEGYSWKTDRSLADKMGKSGIVRKGDGVELCWGQGSPGDHVWTTSLDVTGLVQVYSDYDGFNFMFVNPGMAAAPEKVSIIIEKVGVAGVWNSQTTKVWGFGFEGEVNVRQGRIVAETTSAMKKSNSVIIMARFDKGMFVPGISHSKSFSDVEKKAKKGSDYKEDAEAGKSHFGTIALLLALLGGGGYLGLNYAKGKKYNVKLFGTPKVDGWYRNAPVNGNLFGAYYVLDHSLRFSLMGKGHEMDLIAAFFLKWVQEKKMIPQIDPHHPKRVNLVLRTDVGFTDRTEMSLYEMAMAAAGDNMILEPNEFERWSRNNFGVIEAWPRRGAERGRRYLIHKGWLQADKKVATRKGQEELRHVMEYRNFLKDFTLSSERQVPDVHLWKDMLVFAALFGMAEKVSAQLKKLYPVDFEKYARELELEREVLDSMFTSGLSLFAKAYSNAADSEFSRSGGGGGSSSIGGGGGFSGGGVGGGSR